MRIFNYHPVTFELVSEALARQDPLDAEHFLVPRFATPVLPPEEIPEGKAALFDPEAETWSLADDDRGTWFGSDGEAIAVYEIGAKPDQAVTRTVPTEPFQKFEDGSWRIDTDRKAAAAIAEVNASCEAGLAAIRDQYPLSEILSWSKQEAEARALLKDGNAPAPLLNAMAINRGVGVIELAQRVVAKADAYTTLVGQAIGTRQKAEDDIERASGSAVKRGG